MYKKARCTCKFVDLPNKPIAFLTFSLPSPSSLLKLPSVPIMRTRERHQDNRAVILTRQDFLWTTPPTEIRCLHSQVIF